MKECPYRYVSPELIGRRKTDVLRCRINDRHGKADIERVCINCRVDELEPDCKHMEPRTRFAMGGHVESLLECTLYNTLLNESKEFCKDCQHKELI